MPIIEFVAFILVVIGVWLIGKPSIWGVWFMFVAQITWAAQALLTPERQWWLFAQSISLLILNVRSAIRWKKQGVGIGGKKDN